MMLWKLMKLDILSLLMKYPNTLSKVHSEHPHFLFGYWLWSSSKDNISSQRALFWEPHPNTQLSNICNICAFVHGNTETWRHLQISQQLVTLAFPVSSIRFIIVESDNCDTFVLELRPYYQSLWTIFLLNPKSSLLLFLSLRMFYLFIFFFMPAPKSMLSEKLPLLNALQ